MIIKSGLKLLHFITTFHLFHDCATVDSGLRKVIRSCDFRILNWLTTLFVVSHSTLPSWQFFFLEIPRNLFVRAIFTRTYGKTGISCGSEFLTCKMEFKEKILVEIAYSIECCDSSKILLIGPKPGNLSLDDIVNIENMSIKSYDSNGIDISDYLGIIEILISL